MKSLSLKIAMLVALFFTSIEAKSQESLAQVGADDSNVSLNFDARLDGVYEHYSDDLIPSPEDKMGFQGSYLKLILSGKINDKFSYAFRYRMYKDAGEPREFFNATDWINLTYQADKHWSITAGKQVVAVGTYEYDYAPIDVYYASYYWNHCNPYQIGVAVTNTINEGNKISAQITNSPYSEESLDGLFAYNLIWYGTIKPWWHTIYSVNMMEHVKGHFVNYLALGNQLKFGDATVELDWINRYVGNGTKYFKDYTVVGLVDYKIGRFNLQVKAGYDRNANEMTKYYDTLVTPGVDQAFWGCTVEYHPIAERKNKVRVHASFNNDGRHKNTFLIGVRWQMEVLKLNF